MHRIAPLCAGAKLPQFWPGKRAKRKPFNRMRPPTPRGERAKQGGTSEPIYHTRKTLVLYGCRRPNARLAGCLVISLGIAVKHEWTRRHGCHIRNAGGPVAQTERGGTPRRISSSHVMTPGIPRICRRASRINNSR